ncbi:MAG: hypothetical protein MSG64_11920 [Pyrinomonadaceae bacterium MAG19_C2-C3]|nr:hypothetical protein [Pyrinomonadaceae bacterium MAG19_C2-C3]
MNAERWQQVKEVLHSASERPPSQRLAFVRSVKRVYPRNTRNNTKSLCLVSCCFVGNFLKDL